MAFWSGLFGKRDSDPRLDAPPVTLANLRLQLFSESYFGMQVIERAGSALRPLAPGLVEAIVEDVGGGERTMRWDYLRAFGKSDAELFDLARKQASTANGHVEVKVLDGVDVMVTNDFYLSAYLLERFSRGGAHGRVVAPISWHHWCVHELQGGSLVAHLQMMHFLAQAIAEEASLSDAERLGTDLYWMQPSGTFERIEFERDEPVLSRELAKTFESL